MKYEIKYHGEVEWKEIRRKELIRVLAENWFLSKDMDLGALGWVTSADYVKAEKEVRKIAYNSARINVTYLYMNFAQVRAKKEK